MALEPRPASIQTRALTKSFAGRAANRDVDFRATAGEVHALLGENGAGKSTLVAMLSGAYRPDSGTILVAGQPVQFRAPRDALRAGIGVVHQEFRLVPTMTVAENVLLGSGQRPGAAARRRIAAAAASAGFALDLDRPVEQLGIGQRQQAEILKLLFRNLDVLIFDEPTAVLGDAQIAELFTALAMLRAHGRTIVIVTHRLREVRAIADRLTVLREGTVRAMDVPPDALTDKQLAELMVGPGARAVVSPGARPRGEIVLRMEGVHAQGALRGIDLAVASGEVVGIAGVRGNGQREIAEVAAGTIAADAGQIERTTPAVGFVPEDRLGMGLSRRMSVAENLALRRYREPPIGRPWALSRRAMHRLAAEQIAAYGIPATPASAVARLSGGNLQRVVVARELDRGAGLIVAAQPTRGLDLRSASFVRSRLLAAANAGAGVLLVSEDLDELIETADRIVVLYQGAIVATLPRAEFDRQRIGAVMLGADAA